MPQLDPTWFASQLFWLFVCFALLYLMLSRVFLPRLMGTMEQRQSSVEGDLGAAGRLKTEAEAAKDHYERTMQEARARSQQLFADAVAAQKAQAEQATSKQEADIAAKLREAEKKISTKKQELMDALTPATAELTASIVEKLTQRQPASEKIKMAVGGMAKGGR